VIVIDSTSAVLAHAIAYRSPRLGSLDPIHLATAEPFRADVTAFVTYDDELSEAARALGFPVSAPD